jgi:agmatinase
MSQAGIKPVYAWDILEGCIRGSEIARALSEQVYITIDLDVLDPSVMPAVGTPEPGGIGWYELMGLLREVCAARQVVGFDIVELCPQLGPPACAYLAAKLAYTLIGNILYGGRELR